MAAKTNAMDNTRQRRKESKAIIHSGGTVNALWRWGWLVAAAAGILIYLPSVRYDFTYDDVLIVKNNPRIRELSNWRAYLATSYWDSPGQNREYRPLAIASYALNFAVGGESPVSYRITNILLHGAICAAIWLLLAVFFARKDLGTIAATLFAIHPIHVEVAAGVVGRAELMASLGFILALVCALNSMRADSAARWKWAMGVMGCAAFALGSKENALTLVPAILTLPLFEGMQARNTGRPAPGFSSIFPAALLCAIAAAAYIGLRVVVLGGISGPPGQMIAAYDNPLVDLSPLPRLLTAVKLLARYALMLLSPFNPSPDFSYGAIPLVLKIYDLSWLVGAATVPLFFWIGWKLRNRPASSLGIVLFFITFVITSNIFFLIGTILAERLLYLPSLGFCVAAADLALWAKDSSRAASRARAPVTFALGAAAIWAAALAGQTLRYLPVWKNNPTLFAYMVQRVPGSARAHINHAIELNNQHKFDDAIGHLRQSLEIMPHQPMATGILGSIYLGQGKLKEARGLLEEAQSMAPDSEQIIMTLARVYYLMREPKERIRSLYESALAVNPNNHPLRRDYGILLQEWSEWGESAKNLEMYIEAKHVAADVAVFSSLAEDYKNLGDTQKSEFYRMKMKGAAQPLP
ncbi:tetratricopeptide repeat protein [Candidatus Sumerlaeota bacterium]|nr:tetratricopeptide repeat protein [Candidatus Sumerlaeota bacterium]